MRKNVPLGGIEVKAFSLPTGASCTTHNGVFVKSQTQKSQAENPPAGVGVLLTATLLDQVSDRRAVIGMNRRNPSTELGIRLFDRPGD